jgi:hypothetical protein
MLRVSFWLLVLLAFPYSAGAQGTPHHVPPGVVEGDNTINKGINTVEPPMEMRNRQINVQQVKQEAEELRTLANALPAQIDQVANNQLPKDLSDNLKKIEKLAKHLRSEVAP